MYRKRCSCVYPWPGFRGVSWTYNDAYRLTGETAKDQSGTTTSQASYSYDGVGNRTSATFDGQTITDTYNSLDQLTSAGTTQYSYDGRGNLAQISAGSSVTRYTYDAADRLTGATLPNGQGASYAYDADGRRVQQTRGSSVTNYLWDEASTFGDVVLESDGSGATQASYVLGADELLAQTRGGTTSYDLYDGQGSVRLLTSSSGGVTDRYTYVDGWVMMVGLIGEGPEIHLGAEASLAQWHAALASSELPWIVHCPSKIASFFPAASQV